MPQKTVYLVGFGSQGSAWAQCLRRSGWSVQVYLGRREYSFKKAQELEFATHLLAELPLHLNQLNNDEENTEPAWIAMLCPDTEIAPIYMEYLAPVERKLRLILAHGFSVFTGELTFQKSQHQASLLAPKAIGPKILENFEKHYPSPHTLCAAFCPSSPEDSNFLKSIARGLGFEEKSLIPASFDQETLGDLMSEQGLLCGGVFNLLEWTMEAMIAAGIPEALIREECLTELELVAGILRERGPASAFKMISQAAQCGTVAMTKRFENSEFKKEFKAQMASIQNHEFSRFFHSQEWRTQAKELTERLASYEEKLKKS